MLGALLLGSARRGLLLLVIEGLTSPATHPSCSPARDSGTPAG